MANPRIALIALDPLRITGGPHDVVVAIQRADMPNEMFDPASANRSAGPDARFFTQGDVELPREYIAGSFVLDSVLGAGDGTAIYHVRVPGLVSTDPAPGIKISYGDRTLADYAVTDPFGRNATWADAEFAIVSTDKVDHSGNHAWTASNPPAANMGGPLGDYLTYAGDNRLRSTSAGIMSRLATLDWSVTIVSRKSAYAINRIVGGVEATDGIFFYPMADTPFGQPVTQGARIWWRDVHTTNVISVNNTAQAGLWQWFGFRSGTNAQRLLINGGQFSDSETFSTAGAGPFTGGAFDIGGRGDGTQDWDGDIAAFILWKTGRSDDFIASEYNINRGGAWTAGAPQDVGGGEAIASYAGFSHAHALTQTSIIDIQTVAAGLLPARLGGYAALDRLLAAAPGMMAFGIDEAVLVALGPAQFANPIHSHRFSSLFDTAATPASRVALAVAEPRRTATAARDQVVVAVDPRRLH